MTALRRALEAGECIPAFNAYTLPQVEGICRAAREADRITWLQISRRAWHHWGDDVVEWLVTRFVPTMSDGRAFAHLDHGWSIDAVQRAVDLGFASVMFDGSHLPVEENILRTRYLLENLSRSVVVEGEIGVVGRIGIATERTNPDEAVRFQRATGVDVLAISAGTTHGQPTTEFEWSIVEAVSSMVGVPLALHGGSGMPREWLPRAIEAGFRKFNFATAVERAEVTALRRTIDGGDVDTTELATAVADEVTALCFDVFDKVRA